MKLNNKGWSLNTLIICIVVLLLFLMLSIYNAYKLSSKFSNNTQLNNNTNSYTDSNYNNSSDNSYNSNTDNNSGTGDNESSNDKSDLNDNPSGNDTNNNIPSYYANKESQLVAATTRYLRENTITVAEDEKIVVRIADVIKDKFIQSIKDDKTNNVCDAYSVVGYKDNDYQVTAYISCDSYETKNYGVTE